MVRGKRAEKVYYVILRQCKRKTIYVTILIGCHTKCFNVIFVRTTQNHPHTLARSLASTIYYARFVLFYFFLSQSFSFCGCDCRCHATTANLKELLLGFAVRFFLSGSALITVNNFQPPQKHMQRVIFRFHEFH